MTQADSKPVIIALDSMGGQQAPDMVIEGANVARVRHPDIRFILFGDAEQLQSILDRFPKLGDASEIRHCETAIGDDDKPSVALRQGRR